MAFDDVSDVVRQRMSRIRKTGSKPEVIVRQIAHRLGYRFRKNSRDLPGTPDIVFPSRRKVVFVHGCFWHQHSGCPLGKQPKSRLNYWLPKLDRNVARDVENQRDLEALGWKSLVIWECEVRAPSLIESKLWRFLD